MILEHDLLTNNASAGIFAGLPCTRRIVDVGCGIRPCPAFPCVDHVCIEPHDEYIARLKQWQPTDRHVIIVEGEAERLADQPRENTTVLLLDVVEHMEKDRSRGIVRFAKEFEHAVIFTPLGWCEQDESNPDGWGLNGGFWQKHRSAWQPEDFVGWRLWVWPKWYPDRDVGAILAVR
jgi:hypothetical protein